MLKLFKEKRFTLLLLALLALLPVLSWGGALAEKSITLPEKMEHSVPLEDTLSETVPCLPGASYRFSVRNSRTITVPGNRIRPWTPAKLDTEKTCIEITLSPDSFELPESVKISYTTFTISTTPVRAGPEYIFS